MRATGWALVGLTLLAVAGCTPEGRESDQTDRTITPVPTSPTPSPVTEVALPEADPGLTTLTHVAPTSGTLPAGVVQAKAGTLRVLLNCRGGELTLHLEPFSVLKQACASDQVSLFGHEIELSTARVLSVRVEAAAAVSWSLRIEQ